MGIQAKVIADSISEHGVRVMTLQVRFHRFILPQVLTHRVFSRNTASNRAVNVEKMIENVRSNPAVPVAWGRDQRGMVAKAEIRDKEQAEKHWLYSADMATRYADVLAKMKVHKQITNRITIPYQYVTMLITATEWSNFFELRTADDPQPEVIHLAKAMQKAMDRSEPETLSEGQWHLPYIPKVDADGNPSYYDFEDGKRAAKLSMGPCARVSYENHDKTDRDEAKDLAFADRLISSKHWSPAEHQCSPMAAPTAELAHRLGWDDGTTHQDRQGNMWSGNLRGWVQFRQLLEQTDD